MTGPKQFKFCKKCDHSKPVDDFYVRSNGYRSTWCKPCTIEDNNRRKAEQRRVAREARLALPPPDGKVCTKCGASKLLVDFYGKHSECKLCFRKRMQEYGSRPEIRARMAIQGAAYREQNRAAIRARHLWKKYGITAEEYDAWYEAQDGRCRVCETPTPAAGLGGTARTKVMCVDHDHDTGQVRGLLCHRCNRALGLMQDDAEILLRAITYLQGAAHD